MSEVVDATMVEQRVLRVVREVLAIDGDGPAIDSNIGDDLGVDSLDLLSLFMALEDEFGGTIPEEEAERLSTLRDVAIYVQERMAAAAVE